MADKQPKKVKDCPFVITKEFKRKPCNDFCKLWHNGRCAFESISLSLWRISEIVNPREKLKEVIEKLENIDNAETQGLLKELKNILSLKLKDAEQN